MMIGLTGTEIGHGGVFPERQRAERGQEQAEKALGHAQSLRQFRRKEATPQRLFEAAAAGRAVRLVGGAQRRRHGRLAALAGAAGADAAGDAPGPRRTTQHVVAAAVAAAAHAEHRLSLMAPKRHKKEKR